MLLILIHILRHILLEVTGDEKHEDRYLQLVEAPTISLSLFRTET